MTIDRYTKAVLTVIAVALMVLVLQPFHTPAVARATAPTELRSIASDVHSIQEDFHSIAEGVCKNRGLCPWIADQLLPPCR